MKIIPVNPITAAPAVEPARTGADNRQRSAFAKVLSTAAQAPKSRAPILKPSPSIGVVTPSARPTEHDLMSTATALLDDLAYYQGLLADHCVSLRDLAPRISELEQSAARLAQLAEELPLQHPVKIPAMQLVVTAEQEVARFNSGAYIPG